MKAKIMFIFLVGCLIGCATSRVEVFDVKRVVIGDSMQEVKALIGEPHAVISRRTIGGGMYEEVWSYDAIERQEFKESGRRETKRMSIYSQKMKDSLPTYIITFEDEKVVNITKKDD